MSIRLRFAHWGYGGEVWTLDLGEKVVLRDSFGKVAVEFPYQKTLSYFELPGLLRGARYHYLGIRTDTGLKRFRLDKENRHAIEVFMDYVRAKQDPQSPRRIRRWALMMMVGGPVLSVACIVGNPVGGYYEECVLAAGGIAWFVYGVVTWRRSARMQRLAQEESWGPEGPTGLR